MAGLDYRFPGKIKNPDGSISYRDANNFDEEASAKDGSTRSCTISEEAQNDTKKFLESDNKDQEQEVTVQQLRQIEAMLSKKCKKCMTIKVP